MRDINKISREKEEFINYINITLLNSEASVLITGEKIGEIKKKASKDILELSHLL